MSATYYGLADKNTLNSLLFDVTTGQLEIYETIEQAEKASDMYSGILIVSLVVAKEGFKRDLREKHKTWNL